MKVWFRNEAVVRTVCEIKSVACHGLAHCKHELFDWLLCHFNLKLQDGYSGWLLVSGVYLCTDIMLACDAVYYCGQSSNLFGFSSPIFKDGTVISFVSHTMLQFNSYNVLVFKCDVISEVPQIPCSIALLSVLSEWFDVYVLWVSLQFFHQFDINVQREWISFRLLINLKDGSSQSTFGNINYKEIVLIL
jgi:hypothetical protein